MIEKPGRQEISGYVVRDYQHLIAVLCASRDSQQLTNADIGRRIPIDRASVSRWLTGVGVPRGEKLVEMIGALGYDLALVKREDADAAEAMQCTAETRSWDHFRPDQVDSYWIRCTVWGPHDRHKDGHTGLSWPVEAQ